MHEMLQKSKRNQTLRKDRTSELLQTGLVMNTNVQFKQEQTFLLDAASRCNAVLPS